MACARWIPRRSTEATGRPAKRRMTVMRYAAGGHASQPTNAASPGRTRAATAARPDVIATTTKAGTAKRLANGAASETRWKLIAMMGSVKAATSSSIFVNGNSAIVGAQDARFWKTPVSRGVNNIRPRVAAKLSGYATKKLRLLHRD